MLYFEKLKNSFGFFIIIVALSVSSIVNRVESVEYFKEKPAYISSCKIFEPGFTKCSTESVQKLMDQIVIGIPELAKTFGPIEPMKLDKLVFKQDNNNVANLNADLTDITIKGFSKIRIKESRVSKKDFSWETKVFLPQMRIDANYKMNGKILLIPLSGSGKMFIDIENMDILTHTKTRLYEKGGFTFYNVTQVKVDLDMSGVKSNFENIFNGNSKEVEKSTNEFFNKNWREFFEALRPLVSETVERVMLDLMKKTFDLYPANFFVEDIPTSEQLYGKSKE